DPLMPFPAGWPGGPGPTPEDAPGTGPSTAVFELPAVAPSLTSWLAGLTVGFSFGGRTFAWAVFFLGVLSFTGADEGILPSSATCMGCSSGTGFSSDAAGGIDS